MNNNAMIIRELLNRPIAYHKRLVQIAGVTGAVMLSQAIYWSNNESVIERDGWFWKTQEEWEEETGLTRREQEGARKKLKKSGILVENLQGNPAQLWYMVDFDALVSWLIETDQASMAESAKQEWRNPPNKYGGKRQTIYTKTTSYTTSPEKKEKNPEKKPKPEQVENNELVADKVRQLKHNKVRRELKKKYGGSIPSWVNLEEEVERTPDVQASVSITPEYKEFCQVISEDRGAFHIPTVEGQRLFNGLLNQGYEVAHIKCASRIAYRVDDFWKNNYTPELFFRKVSSSSGQAIDNVGKFVNYRAGGNSEITQIKQEMKHDLAEQA